MLRSEIRWWAVVLAWGALLCGPAAAHEDLDRRIDTITRALARDPDSAALLMQRAELHRLHRDWRSAEADLDAVGRLSRSTSDLDLARARLAIDRGDDAQGARHLERHLDAKPDSAIGYSLRADLLERAGRFAEAARDHETAIRKSPEPRIEEFQRWAADLSASGQPAAAVSALDAGIARFGPLVSLEHPAVEMLVAGGRWDDALIRLNDMLRRGAPRETLLTWQAEILLAAGRPDLSLEVFQQAREAWNRLPQHARETIAMQRVLGRIERGLATPRRGGIDVAAH